MREFFTAAQRLLSTVATHDDLVPMLTHLNDSGRVSTELLRRRDAFGPPWTTSGSDSTKWREKKSLDLVETVASTILPRQHLVAVVGS